MTTDAEANAPDTTIDDALDALRRDLIDEQKVPAAQVAKRLTEFAAKLAPPPPPPAGLKPRRTLTPEQFAAEFAASTTLETGFRALRDRLRAEGCPDDEIAAEALALAVGLVGTGERDWLSKLTIPADPKKRQFMFACRTMQLAGQAMAAASDPQTTAGILGSEARKHRMAEITEAGAEVEKALSPVARRLDLFCQSMHDEGYSACMLGPSMTGRGARLIRDAWGAERTAEFLRAVANTAALQGPAVGQA